MTSKEQTNNMSYYEYRNNELILMNKRMERNFNLVRGLGLPLVPFQIMFATAVKDLYSREFLIYFLQNQKRLVEEQTDRLRKSMDFSMLPTPGDEGNCPCDDNGC